MNQNINDVLIAYFQTGGAIPSYLNGIISMNKKFQSKNITYETFVTLLQDFFQTRTDIRRVHLSQQVSKIILDLFDLDEFVEIRQKIAELELLRIIKYENQRDHTVHTVYLFLLGLWLFENVPYIQANFKKWYSSEGNSFEMTSNILETSENDYNKEEAKQNYLIHRFIFQWIYASLIHDIGYVFADLTEDSKDYKKFMIYEIFSYEWLEKYLLRYFVSFQPNSSEKKTIKKAHSKFRKHYEKLFDSKNLMNNPTHILKRISTVPWLNELLPENRKFSENIFELFDEESMSQTKLESFAFDVAQNGYQSSGEPNVDHAISSGLLMFQYSSYWYYLMDQIKKLDVKLFEKIKEEYSYEKENLYEDILPACRATSYHNIDPSQKIYHLSKFDINKNPLVFLSVLCDELSQWERFAVGKNTIININENAANSLDSTDIQIKINLNEYLYRVAEFEILNKTFDIKKMEKTLDKKLKNWKRIVKINKKI